MRVLVTDGSYNQTLAIVRTLGKKGHQVSVTDYNSPAVASLSKYCKSLFILPHQYKERFDTLVSVLGKNKFDLLIPVGSDSARFVATYYDALQGLTKFEIPDKEKILFALNKKNTHALAKKLDIPIPLTFYPASIDEVKDFNKILGFPVVIKALEDTGSHIIDYAFDKNQLVLKYKQLCKKFNFEAPNLPMIQEYIKGEGYGFFALYQKGELKRSFMHHRLREYPVQGGASSCAESFWDLKLKEYGKKLLDELEWNGAAMAEFKKDGKDYKFLELNPKFWGSLDLAIASGVDFPSLLCEMAEGREIAYSEKYKLGIKYHWPLSDDLMHIIEKPEDIPDFLGDCITAESNISIQDIFPNLWELKGTFKQVFL